MKAVYKKLLSESLPPPPLPLPNSVGLTVLAFPALQSPPGWGVCPGLARQASLPTAITMLTAGAHGESGLQLHVVLFAAHPAAPAHWLTSPRGSATGAAVTSPGQRVGQLGPQPRLSSRTACARHSSEAGPPPPPGCGGSGARAEEWDGVGLGSPLTFNPRRPTLSLSHALLFGRASLSAQPTPHP